jgi:hypothetical protein
MRLSSYPVLQVTVSVTSIVSIGMEVRNDSNFEMDFDGLDSKVLC